MAHASWYTQEAAGSFVHFFVVVRSGQSTVGGPKWTQINQNGPFWSILVSRMPKSGSAKASFSLLAQLDLYKLELGGQPSWLKLLSFPFGKRELCLQA